MIFIPYLLFLLLACVSITQAFHIPNHVSLIHIHRAYDLQPSQTRPLSKKITTYRFSMNTVSLSSHRSSHLFQSFFSKIKDHTIQVSNQPWITKIRQKWKKFRTTLVSSLVTLSIVVMISTRAYAGHEQTRMNSMESSQSITSVQKSSSSSSPSLLRNKGMTQSQNQNQNQLSESNSLFDEKLNTMKNILRDQLHIGKGSSSNPAVVEAIESITSGFVEAENEAVEEIERSWKSLAQSLSGIKHDGLFLLVVTSIIVPLFRQLKVSPIIGFLLTGTIVGPTGLNFVNDVHMIDVLGELGIVFFLFEMGLELSMERLIKMKRDVFGLGTSQFLITAAVAAGISMLAGLSSAAAVTIGGSLALSSSAFVLQLLKDKNAMGTRHGKASFGILLLQDLAVVPLIVIVELLSQGGAGLGKALTVAGIKAMVALQAMSYIGRKLLDPIFFIVARSSSQEAFLSIILSTVLMMSFFTKGIGLSDTLGAFLAGLLLAETKYRYQIEADISPFRGILLGVFFITVGFSIDLNILITSFPQIIGLLFSLLVGKAIIITGLCSLFGLSIGSSAQCGLLNAQGGEFAFVSLGIAERAGLIPSKLSKMLLTTVALSMAVTPLLAELGANISNRLEKSTGTAHYLGQDSHAEEVKSEMRSHSFVFVCGYGRVGKMVCDMLDRKFIRYVALDNSPQRAIEARNKGLPVFFGDITRPEVLKGFDVGSAEACVIAIDDIAITNRAVMIIRKNFPDLPIIVRAKNTQHQKRLDQNFVNVFAMSPVLPDDSVLLTLPFGGAVLQKIGVSKPEIDAILEDFRKMYIDDKELDEGSFDFLTSFRRRLPPSIDEIPPEEQGLTDGKISIPSIESEAKSIADTESRVEAIAVQSELLPFAEVGYLATDASSRQTTSNHTETLKQESPDFYLSDLVPMSSHNSVSTHNSTETHENVLVYDSLSDHGNLSTRESISDSVIKALEASSHQLNLEENLLDISQSSMANFSLKDDSYSSSDVTSNQEDDIITIQTDSSDSSSDADSDS